MSYGVLAFDSTHDAIVAERTLKGWVKVTMMPTPRCITASCGISLRFDLKETDRLRDSLTQLSGFKLYRVDETGCMQLPLEADKL